MGYPVALNAPTRDSVDELLALLNDETEYPTPALPRGRPRTPLPALPVPLPCSAFEEEGVDAALDYDSWRTGQ